LLPRARSQPIWCKAMKNKLNALEKKIKLGPLYNYPKERNP
jgi:hypothetical protein